MSSERSESRRLRNWFDRTWPRVLGTLYRWYHCSLRIEIWLPDGRVQRPREFRPEPAIYAHCERDLLVLSGMYRFYRGTVLIAMGWDGDWLSRALPGEKVTIIRGSSRHESSRALSDLIADLSSHSRPAIICVDGPAGPAGQAKPGVLYCSRITGRRVIPVGVSCRRSFRFSKTWSGLFLPFPFSRVVVDLGAPIQVAQDTSAKEIRGLCETLSLQIRDCSSRAENLIREGGGRP